MSNLYWTSAEEGAAEALGRSPGMWTVLVSTPTSYTVAVASGGTLRVAGDDPWELPADCFQITAFDGRTELRWLADGAGGRAVWLAEQADALPSEPGGGVAFDHTLDQRSVLWGEPAAPESPGFSAWSSSRIGLAHYPCEPGLARDRAVLEALEYIAHDEHGNAAVVERRLVAIRRLREDTG